MSAPVSSLSLSSCLNSTVTALSQSRPASSTSVVLLMKKEPKKSVARIPGGGRVTDHWVSPLPHISPPAVILLLLAGKPHLCWFAPS